jgi:TatD DNase family protein
VLIDTHCHIHEADYPLDIDETLRHAADNGVGQLICVGTSLDSSRRAIAFAKKYPQAYAAIGVHPHDTKDGYEELASLLKTGDVVAVGEIGLDYFYNHSPREIQIKALEWQIELALKNNLPIIFHVREAFEDFWPVFDNFKGVRGELHSFTDTQTNLQEGLKRGLNIGVNGISTFTKDDTQIATFRSIPLSRLLLETDAPFLTPVPFRGKPNEPAYVKNIAEFHARLRETTLDEVAQTTSANARALFNL